MEDVIQEKEKIKITAVQAKNAADKVLESQIDPDRLEDVMLDIYDAIVQAAEEGLHSVKTGVNCKGMENGMQIAFLNKIRGLLEDEGYTVDPAGRIGDFGYMDISFSEPKNSVQRNILCILGLSVLFLAMFFASLWVFLKIQGY